MSVVAAIEKFYPPTLTLQNINNHTNLTMGETSVNGGANGTPIKKQLILNAFVESCKSSLHFE
jgi:hypothetical protein